MEYNVFSGVTSTGKSLNNDIMYVHSGGTANSTSITGTDYSPSGYHLYVYNGGTANNTMVNAWGFFIVSSGGIANSTSVNSVGYFSVTNGGTANSTSVSNGYFGIFSGGTANSTTVNYNGYFYVSSGGIANSTSINSRGRMIVSSGGTANEILENGGYVNVEDGANVVFASNTISGLDLSNLDSATVHSGTTANYTRIFSGSYLAVYSGGVVNSATVNSSGSMHVSSGGTANSITVTGRSYFVVSSGGTATNIAWTPCVGNVTFENGAYVTFVSQYSGVYYGSNNQLLSSAMVMEAKTLSTNTSMYVMSGGTANNTTVTSARMFVSCGGTANSTTVNSGGSMFISSGGTANAIIENGGCVNVEEGANAVFASNTLFGLNIPILTSATVHSGTTANNTVVINSSYFVVYSGGVVNSTTVKGGWLYLSSGGTANSTTVIDNGNMYVSSGGTANNTTVNWGSMVVSSGGTANSTTVHGGSMYVSSGGTANSTTVHGGSMYVSSGGYASGIVAESNATIGFAVASDTYVQGVYSGSAFEMKDAFISGYTVDYGSICVCSGGSADNTTVNWGGSMHICSGGSANNTTVNWGSMYICSGGYASGIVAEYGMNIGFAVASDTYVQGVYSGSAFEMKDAFISGYTIGYTIENWGSMFVHSGGTANSTTVNYGHLTVYSGGTANSTTVKRLGSMFISSGGTANNTTVNSGGSMFISSGGTATGKIVLEFGAFVSAYEGAVLNFDLTQTEAGAEALVNNISLVRGAPIYTLTVAGTEADGTYLLADGAAGFSSTISVVNVDGDELGTFTLNQTISIGDKDYTLNLTDGTLSVMVDDNSFILPDAFFTGDFNGDGYDMLAVQKDSTITIYMNGEPWGLGVTLDPGWEIAGVGDFDGDLVDDFLRVNDEGYVVGEMSNGNGTFSPQVLNFLNDGWQILGTGDFDSSGYDDVLVANPTGASETVGLLGYWEGGSTWVLINGYSAEWECIATGDFNADGNCDMLWRNSFEGEGGLIYNAYCTWLVGLPEESMTGGPSQDWFIVSVANPDEWNFLCSGDFNGDNANDIAMINGEGVVGIWGVEGGMLSSWSILSAVDTSTWTLAGVGDFNGDGTDDIAWCNKSTGQVGCWQINDKQLTAWSNIASIA